MTHEESEKQKVLLSDKNISGFIQRRLDYFFVSNLPQEFVTKMGVLAAFSTDQSPLLLFADLRKDEIRGKTKRNF